MVHIRDIWNTYYNELLGIKFSYPPRWIKTCNERYEGIEGFFELSALFSEKTLLEECQYEAYHKLLPYGTKPSTLEIKLDECPAYLIYPSSDQPSEMKNQAALIIKCQKIFIINQQKYNYLLLKADKKHMKKMLSTIKLKCK